MKKPRDEAQKWRAFKNIARMFKNPFGYMYWKSDIFNRNQRVRIMYVNLAYCLFQSWMITVICKSKKESMMEMWRHQTGQLNTGYKRVEN